MKIPWTITLTIATAVIVRAAQAPVHDAAWVHARVVQWQPSTDERKMDRIGWASDIRQAEQIAQQHHRPVFLFTHDGHMGIGRC